MRAVWSFWSRPFTSHHHTHWVKPVHHLFSWVISLETARKHFSRTVLYTDDDGARLLVDQLGLQFDEVSTDLNVLASYDPAWWSLGKVWTYRAQHEPFIHIDSDVFLWQPLPPELISAPLFVQCPDFFVPNASHYKPELLESTISRGGEIWLPAEWVWFRASGARQRGESCGIFGGRRIDFIQHYTNQAFKLLEHPANQPGWSHMKEKSDHNILLEQYLLAACIDYHRDRPASPFRDIEIKYLFSSLDDALASDDATRLGYTHLVGTAKKNPHIITRLEQRMQRDYPEYYERCLEIEDAHLVNDRRYRSSAGSFV